MARKLTLVVTCTDRKATPPLPEHMARNLPSGPQRARARMFKARLQDSESRTPLRHLYQGEAWAQALKLEQAARDAGFEPELLVASAGLGLLHASNAAPAYAATFSPRQPDTVAANSVDTKLWWREMSDGPASTKARSHLEDSTLLVLSQTYAAAMLDELESLQGRDDVVVFGGSSAISGISRIPADRQLRAALGGTSTSLNLRTARVWLQHLPKPSLQGSHSYPGWTDWVTAARRPEIYDRQPLADSAVISFVRELHATDRAVSKTRALRLLRNSGLACEQKRFGRLFDTAVRGV